MTDSQTTWHKAVPFSELDDEEPTQLEIQDQVIALCKVGDEVFAISDICTHEQAYLSDGIIEDGCVECPLHMALFDIKTGKAMTEPASVDLKTFPVRMEDGVVWIEV